MKISVSENKANVKKPIYKRWWFWLAIAFVVIAAMSGEDTPSEPANVAVATIHAVATTEPEPVFVDEQQVTTSCRVLTRRLIENAFEEEYKMTAFSIESQEFDENGDGEIKVLYWPKGSSKVNIKISKRGNTYTTTYVMVAGLYELDLSIFTDSWLKFVYSE